MASDWIEIRGAREHNLRNVDVDIPRERLVVITGLSGSGKSSLAFDTLYAEGQRRYVESLSAYARQFLGQMEKPDVDSIEGLSPAISIDQKATSRNPRSTVGTVTEIYDYLRLLYARVGKPHCPRLRPADRRRRRPSRWSTRCWRCPTGTRFTVLAPVVRGRKGEYQGRCSRASEARASRASRSTARSRLLEEGIELDKKFKHDIDVVVDRLIMKADLRKRLADSVETALRAGRGPAIDIAVIDGETRWTYSEKYACPEHGVSLPRSRRACSRSTRRTAPARRATASAPRGARPRHDRARRRAVDLRRRARCRGTSSGVELLRERHPRRVADHFDVSLDTPWGELPDEQRKLFLYGTGGQRVLVTYKNRQGRKRQYMMAFEGIIAGLDRRYRETESSMQRERIEEYMTLAAVPDVQRARACRPESLAVTVGEPSTSTASTGLSVARRARLLSTA